MSTKKPAAAQSATPAAKKPRKPRSPGIDAATKFAVMAFVKDAASDMPDATLAEQATAKFSRKFSALQIKGYRATFGIASVGRPKAAALQQMLDEANAKIAALNERLAALEGEPVAEAA